MNTPPSPKLLEALSSYLDGELRESEMEELQTQIHSDPDLLQLYNELKTLKAVIRSIPEKKPRSNLTLTPEMVGRPTLRFPRMVPIFGLASALSLVMIITSYFAGNLQAAKQSITAQKANAPQAEAVNPEAIEPVNRAKDLSIIVWGGNANYINQPAALPGGMIGRGGGGGGGGPEGAYLLSAVMVEPPAAPPMEAAQPTIIMPEAPLDPETIITPEPALIVGTEAQPEIPLPAAGLAMKAAPGLSPAPEVSPTPVPTVTPYFSNQAPAQIQIETTETPLTENSPILGVPSADARGKIQPGNLQPEQPETAAPAKPSSQIDLVRIILAGLMVLFGAAAGISWVRYKNASH